MGLSFHSVFAELNKHFGGEGSSPPAAPAKIVNNNKNEDSAGSEELELGGDDVEDDYRDMRRVRG